MIPGLSYDRESGEFTWFDCAKPDRNGKRAGVTSGTNGYRYIKHKGKMYPEHQLAWIITNGEIPKGKEIDHINRDKEDNRIDNLRLTTRSGNMLNTKLKPNQVGVRGVSIHKKTGLYRARFRNKVSYFDTLEGAAEGYKALVSRTQGDMI